jgi:hypothetical protein
MLKDAGSSWKRRTPRGGHQMSLAIAAGLGRGGNESYPDVFQPYGGFPDGTGVENSGVTMPELPGIGFEGKSDLYAIMRELTAWRTDCALCEYVMSWPNRRTMSVPGTITRPFAGRDETLLSMHAAASCRGAQHDEAGAEQGEGGGLRHVVVVAHPGLLHR